MATKAEECASLSGQIEELKNNQAGKVDKQVMKSLVLGYFSTPQDKKHDVERLLARILDFNQEEMAKAKLQLSRGGPQSGAPQQSLSTLFVQFLENESAREGQVSGLRKTSQPVRDLAKDLTKVANGAPSAKELRANPFLSPSTSTTPAPVSNNQLLSSDVIRPASVTPLFVASPDSTNDSKPKQGS